MQTKVCSNCKMNKPLCEFNNYKRSPDGLDYRCKTCQRESNKNWCKNNWDKKISQQRIRRQELSRQFGMYKATLSCIVCGCSSPECIDFHHLDPNEKDMDLSTLVGRSCAWERLLEEIQKCVPLCANCHRKVHANTICLIGVDV